MPADAALLVAFGGPPRPEDVRPFLEHVLRGRPVSPERFQEVLRHYEAIGGRSPLNEITLRQANALAAALAARGRPLPVHVGLRHAAPFLADTLTRMADAGVQRAVGVILAPHATEASRERYTEELEKVATARRGRGARTPVIDWVPTWHVHPLFVGAMAARVRTALDALPAVRRARAVLVFTAHSVPQVMADRSPYVADVAASARAVAEALGHPRWQVAYQSRSGSPRERWLEPDVNDALRALADQGTKDAAVIPIGFVSDHVEVLYDLGIEAAATARAANLGFVRAETVGEHPLFVRMLAEIVSEAAG
jgi:ferrochelatase